MAENKEQMKPLEKDPTLKDKKPTYKYGADSIDFDTYLYNISNNVQSYLDYKVKNEGWNDSQVQEFSNSYRLYLLGLLEQRDSGIERFSTDALGAVIDSTGKLQELDNDGIDDQGSEYYYNDKGERITSLDFNKLKSRKLKKYKTFLANREVAAFLNEVGKGTRDLLNANKKPTEKFDLNKHGFLSYWSHVNNPGGGEMDLTPWLEKDAWNEATLTRNVDKRATYLADLLEDYVTQLQDYDFSESNFKDKDTYLARLNNVISHLRDGKWDDEDLIALSQAGINSNFRNAFFSTEEHPLLSDAERKALSDEEKAKEEKEKQERIELQKKEWIDSMLNIFNNNNYLYSIDNPFEGGVLQSDYWHDGAFDSAAFGNSFSTGADVTSYLNSFLANPNNSAEFLRAWAGLIGMGRAKPVVGNPELEGYYYVHLPDTDSITNSTLVYNPTTGAQFHTFIGNIPELWKRMTNAKEIEWGLKQASDKYKFKEGGTIPSMGLGGGFDANAWLENDRKNRISEDAKNNTLNTSYHNGRTAELEEAGRRLGPFAEDTLENPNNGFSGTDMLRLGTIAADIVSMGSAFIPVYGTAVSAATGVSSSLGTFFADAFEDGLDWGDVKNLGTNLSMDALGLIPGGGAASKGMKIAKTLGKYTTRIIAAIGAAHTLSNKDLILSSYNKLLESPSTLTVDDWRNISAGLGLVTGGVAAGTRKYKQAKLKAKANKKHVDNVAVEMIDQNGKKQMVAFEGEDAAAIRKAQKTGDIEELKKATTGKFENFKDWQLSTGSDKHGLLWIRSEGKWQSPFKTSEGSARVFDISGNYDAFRGTTGRKMYVDPGKWSADIPITHVHSKTGTGKYKLETTADIDAGILANEKALMDPLVEGQRKLQNTLLSRKEKLELLKADLDAKKAQLGTNTSESLRQRRQAILEEKKYLATNDIATRVQERERLTASKVRKEQNLAAALQELEKLKQTKGKSPLKRLKIHDLEIEITHLERLKIEAENRLNNFDTANPGADQWRSRLDTNQTDLANQKDFKLRLAEAVNLETDIANLTSSIARLEKWLANYDAGKVHSKAYRQFMKNNVVGTGDDAKVVITSPSALRENTEVLVKDLLEKYQVKFKLGGSFKEIRKFASGSVVRPMISLSKSSANDITPSIPSIPTKKFVYEPKFSDIISMYRLGQMNRSNDKQLDLSKQGNLLFELNPFQMNVPSVKGKIDYLLGGDRSAATIESKAHNLQITDPEKYAAINLEAATQGEGLKLEANKLYNESVDASQAKHDAIVNANAKEEHDTSLKNKLAQLLHIKDNIKFELIRNAQRLENNNRWSSLIEYDIKSNEAAQKAKQLALQERYDLADLLKYVYSNLGSYTLLTPLEQEIITALATNTKSPSDFLGDDKYKDSFKTAYNKASEYESLLRRQYYGLKESPWSVARSMVSNTTPKWEGKWALKSKDGSKIIIANLKARLKDKKEFLDALEKNLKEHNKTMKEFSKDIYSYVKNLIEK